MSKKTVIVFVLSFALISLVVSSVAVTAYSTDEQINVTPTGPAFLPHGSKLVERPPVEREPIHNPAGSQMLVAGLTIPVTCDGYIDPTEWADAYMYDVSDTTGQSDGIPDPLGSVTLWLKQDNNGVYFAVRNNADQTLDDYDQVGLYFDDNYDGCWPVSATNEGNNWLVYDAVSGDFVQWRWIQDLDCGFPPSYVCAGDDYGGFYNWTPSCFGIGIGPTGNVDFEVMIPYGAIDEHLDLTMPPDTLGFYMYCMDYGPYVYNGEWPSQYYSSTYNEACYFGRLICGSEEEWPNHKMHFPQLPDLEGWDVFAIFPKTLADDWQCSETGDVTDIHFWGSWKDIDGDPWTDDFQTPMPTFNLSIHSNLPVGHPNNPYPYSIPGDLLWEWEGEVPGTPFEPPAMEHWYDPNTGEVLYNDHVPYWRYDFFFDQASPPPEPFFQYEDTIYWLNVSALYIDYPYQWGWKTSRDHFMDDAVYTDNPPWGPWYEMYEPPRANWFDVWFDVFEPIDSGSTNYYGQGWYYYEWYDWWNMWFYDNPFTLDQEKHIWMDFFIEDFGGMAIFALNWSTPEWDELGMGRPPLPEDGNEDLYIGRQEFEVYPGPNFIDHWLPYNPEWVSIDFQGAYFRAYGWIWHECVGTSMDLAFVITGEEPNSPPDIIQPDSLYGYDNCDTVIYTFDGVDPDGDVILDDASLSIEPSCGSYSVTRLTGHGTSSGTWEVTWATMGCQDSVTYMIIVDLTDDQGATSWCTTYCHLDRNQPPQIQQPDFLEGYVDSVVEYGIVGTDPEGDVILDQASIDIQPGCGSGYSITRATGHGTSSGVWQITWYTDGCTVCDTHMVIHDLTDVCGNTAYCTTWVHIIEKPHTGWYWKDPYPDYAPNGMVDIDQRQDSWIKYDTDQWSFCGPCAVANCFKWFDSKYNVPPGVPGDGIDQFPLVRQYIDGIGGMVSPYDDHDPWNVDHSATAWNPGIGPPPPTVPQPFVPGPQPPGMPPWGELVERLAWYFNTDGIQTGYCEFTGTKVDDMQAGIDAWLRSESFTDGSTLADTLCEVTTPMPTFAYVESLVEKSEDVILLLGFWYYDAPQEFIRGDIDADGFVSFADVVRWMEGPPFLCDDAADANDDGLLTDLDSAYIWDYIFVGGNEPPSPFPDCGLDPTTDALGCGDFPPCPPATGEWYRIGGHYVTVAGVNSEDSMIAFSDPFIDAFEMGFAPGRVGDGSLIPHPHGSHDPTVHNDEGNVCHDMYGAVASPSPGGLWGLPEYAIMADPYYWSWNFFNQNVPDEFMPVTAPWNETSAIFTEVEYCVHISPWDYRGDVNVPGGDGSLNIADVVFIITYLFSGGPTPDPLVEADTNCDGIVNVADAVTIINYLFLGGPIPRCCDP